MQMQDPAADPAIPTPELQSDPADTPASKPAPEPPRRDEPWASGQRKRYLASLPDTTEAA